MMILYPSEYGSTNEIFTRLPYRNLPRPIYPLDPETECEFRFIGR